MSTVRDRLEYTRVACRKRGLAPYIWRLNDADMAALRLHSEKPGAVYYDSMPVERSHASFSSCLTHAAHGANVWPSEMIVADEVGGDAIEGHNGRR